MKKPIKRDVEKAARIKKVAEIAGVSVRHVERVLTGDRNNEKIVDAYLEIVEGENQLIAAVKQLIHF